uniref:Putative DNA binding, helix-turn-helix domain containing protein n=1 Tax=viral metagenome TaxID=1070528 RepID=A0A6M3LXS4_9ZZZZ
MARRSGMDICCDILTVAESGARKTRLVYQANLNFKIVNKYLETLIEAGFLEYREDVKTYFTTDQGSYWMTNYGAIVTPMKAMMEPESEAEAPQL